MRWVPVDRIYRYAIAWRPLTLHGHFVGWQYRHHMYVIKPLHQRAERDCGKHDTYHAPWER